MANITVHIADKEQFPIELQLYDERQKIIREEFIGYVELKCQDAIASEVGSLEAESFQSIKIR